MIKSNGELLREIALDAAELQLRSSDLPLDIAIWNKAAERYDKARAAELPADLTADLATLREIETRTEKAIAACQRVAFDARSEEARQVVREATRCLHLYGNDGSRKHAQCLYEIIRLLAPEIAKIIDDEDYRQADRVTHPEDDE